jgi:2-hydroxy-3-keto-5-methylthiopentenyl-1-phosphate phosphatase
MDKSRYNAIVSSDWNECLAPCGPFDYISYIYPELKDALTIIFKQYTGNQIPLSRAIERIRDMIPEPISPEQMDDYIDREFKIYTGVTDFMEWCLSKKILFMINTTGVIGYFQRIIAKKLIPPIQCLSAHPSVTYDKGKYNAGYVLELHEVEDKARNTERALRSMNITSPKIILMGDSGGDGPHFTWGSNKGAFLIGSMTKPSLRTYCLQNKIEMDLQFGIAYGEGEKKRLEDEMAVDFRELVPVIEEVAGIS